ncbi:nSTAND3 domain-containing NTPase [Streptomyces tauricus]|uniref:nSTAND3 domain-containing NTPase n=1 Tax=Streptomyces tauricus TaxID=68274 RepID=UPI002E2DEB47|nr:hypothetical protein [Streptomyces tauricus]
MGNGYEVHEISQDAEEITALWREETSQLFLYDYFLGQRTLESPLHRNEDARLVGILRGAHLAEARQVQRPECVTGDQRRPSHRPEPWCQGSDAPQPRSPHAAARLRATRWPATLMTSSPAMP